jgi:MtfA peptidase
MRFGWHRPRVAGINEDLWQSLLHAYPFVRRVGEARLARLRDMAAAFLASKQFSAEGGLKLTDDIGAAIALQACLPVVELGLDWYDDFDQIIVYPDQFLVPRAEVDDAGVVHEEDAMLAGESIDGGPVVLSWADVRDFDDLLGLNVVIHEFVHKLDLRDGHADGMPPLRGARARRWQQVLEQSYDSFCDELDRLEASMPAWLDPQSDAAAPWYARLPLDPYAAHDHAEFFAVCGEAFFLTPAVLKAAFPDFFALLADFFGLEPLADLPG